MIGGDIVTAVDGKVVETMQDLSAAIKAQKPGDEVELTVLRDGKEVTVASPLANGRAPGAPPMPTAAGSGEGAHAAQGGRFRRMVGDQRHDAYI